MKPGKVNEPPKRLNNCAFSCQIISGEKNNQAKADFVLYCFRCFCLWIFSHLAMHIVLEVRTSNSVHKIKR